jgi:3',5'-cyclic AMP phosphodiesterase CpdA
MDRKPDAIVLTGDIIDRSAVGYGHALPVLRNAPVPLLPLPGNHDDPLAFRAAFTSWVTFAPDHLSFTAQIADVDLIALDTTLPDGRPGLDATRLDWLAGLLGTLQRPSIVALHHPPFATLIPHLDRTDFQNADTLARLVERSAVCRIIAGHSHRAMQTVWAGCLASTAPAIGHGLSLSLTGAQSQKKIAMVPAFERHLVGQRDMITHQLTVD